MAATDVTANETGAKTQHPDREAISRPDNCWAPLGVLCMIGTLSKQSTDQICRTESTARSDSLDRWRPSEDGFTNNFTVAVFPSLQRA